MALKQNVLRAGSTVALVSVFGTIGLGATRASASPNATAVAVSTATSNGYNRPINNSEGSLSGFKSTVHGLNVSTSSKFGGVTVSAVNSGSKNSSVTAQGFSDGSSSLIETLKDSSAPTRYSYQVSGATSIVKNTDGSLSLVGSNKSTLATIDAPWAFDAKKHAIPTHYEVEGNRITQVISIPTTANFPIVADPHLSWHWWGVSITLSHDEVSKASKVLTLGGGIGGLAKALGAAAASPEVLAIIALGVGTLNACDWNNRGEVISYHLAPIYSTCHAL